FTSAIDSSLLHLAYYIEFVRSLTTVSRAFPARVAAHEIILRHGLLARSRKKKTPPISPEASQENIV
ncbi:MAG: hypothetical protein WCA41_03845, partial [Candidatus Acidiferrum sp.]